MPKYDFNKFGSNFIAITLQHGFPPVNLLHIFRTPFSKNTSERLLLCQTSIKNKSKEKGIENGCAKRLKKRIKQGIYHNLLQEICANNKDSLFN